MTPAAREGDKGRGGRGKTMAERGVKIEGKQREKHEHKTAKKKESGKTRKQTREIRNEGVPGTTTQKY